MKVSVCITTYNHEQYVAQAVDSALAQICDFDYEIIIGEDESSDRTRDIVKAYKRKYPDRIRLLLHDREGVSYVDGKPTGHRNLALTLKHAKGSYVALLDGDDYWTSPEKLHRQVAFLDSHPDCAICFHSVRRLYEDDQQDTRVPDQKLFHKIYTIDDLLARNFITKSSVMFRSKLLGELPAWFYTVPMADWPLHVLNARHGNIGYIDKVMAVHRFHKGSMWSLNNVVGRRRRIVHTLEVFRQNLEPKYAERLEESIALWHIKVLSSMFLARSFREMGPYTWNLLVHQDVSLGALFKAASLAVRGRSNRGHRGG